MHAEQAYVFVHALMRDAAYQLHLPSDRARLHRLALELIESMVPAAPQEPVDGYTPHPFDPFAQDLADHARHARLGVADTDLFRRECNYLMRAAGHAQATHHPLQAVALMVRVLELQVLDEDSNLRVELRCADLLHTAGFSARALERLEHAARVRDLGGALLADFKRLRAVLLRMAGRLDEAYASGLEAVALCPASETRLLGHIHLALAAIRRDQGRPEQGEQEALRAVAYLEQDRDPTVVLSGLVTLSGIQAQTGRFQEAERNLLGAVELAARAKLVRSEAAASANLASVLIDTGRGTDAEPHLRRALALFHELGDRSGIGVVAALQSRLLIQRGELDLALALMRQGLETAREAGHAHAEARLAGNIAQLLVDMGRVREAEAAFHNAIRMCRQHGNFRSEGIQIGNLACFLFDLGRGDEAWPLAQAALAIHRQTGNRPWEAHVVALEALILRKRGETAQAQARYEQAATMMTEMGTRDDLEDLQRKWAVADSPAA